MEMMRISVSRSATGLVAVFVCIVSLFALFGCSAAAGFDCASLVGQEDLDAIGKGNAMVRWEEADIPQREPPVEMCGIEVFNQVFDPFDKPGSTSIGIYTFQTEEQALAAFSPPEQSRERISNEYEDLLGSHSVVEVDRDISDCEYATIIFAIRNHFVTIFDSAYLTGCGRSYLKPEQAIQLAVRVYDRLQ